MAFAGTMGPSGVMTNIWNLRTPGGTPSYASDGISLRKRPIDAATPILPQRIYNIRWVMLNDGGIDPVLGPLEAGGPIAANGDCGTLTTRDPQVNEHGIPANFGPGRGNWTDDDLLRVIPRIVYWTNNGGAPAEPGGLAVARVVLSGGVDLRVQLQNMGMRFIDTIVFELEYRHSIDLG